MWFVNNVWHQSTYATNYLAKFLKWAIVTGFFKWHYWLPHCSKQCNSRTLYWQSIKVV